MSTATDSSAVDPSPKPTLERRLEVRYRLLQRCFVQPEGAVGNDSWRCIAFNLSRTGVGITVPCPLVIGTFLRVTPWNLPHARALLVRVVRLVHGDFVWYAGCEMVAPLDEDEYTAWLAGPLDWIDQY